MLDKVSNLLTFLWAEFLGPAYNGALYYLSQITGIDKTSLDVVLMSVLILASVTVVAHFLPTNLKDALNLTGKGTYDKALFSLTFWVWFELNIRLGTRATILYLFGELNPLIAGPTSWAIALLPSIAQSFFTYKPSKRHFDQQFEKTLFLLDVLATGFGLAITAGYTPPEFWALHLEANSIVLVIWLFGIGGNYWAENALHDMAFQGRGGFKANPKFHSKK